MLSTKSTISEKLKIEKKTQELRNLNQEICFRTLRIFWDAKNSVKWLRSQKLKIGKLIFHPFHNIAQLFRPKNEDVVGRGAWGGLHVVN